MEHKEKVKLKHQAHVEIGFNCTEPVIEEHQAYFYSESNGIFRKHIFTPNDIVIALVEANEYPASLRKEEPVTEAPVVEEKPAEETPVVEEKPAKKKATKKEKK